MILYTIYDPSVIFGNDDSYNNICFSEMNIDGIMVQVSQGSNSGAQIQRIISTNPEDYLNPKLQPGSRIR